MEPTPKPRIFLLLCFLLTAVVGGFGVTSGQEMVPGAKQAYFRAVADHFGVPMAEVEVLGEWGLEPDEVPVVLFVSTRAGVSSDALVGMRKAGQSWNDVARRFGLGGRAFYIFLPEDANLGHLSGAYQKYRSKPAREWDSIELQDLEIVSLVNLKVLSDQVEVTPIRVLRSREEYGSFIGGFMSLLGSSSIG